eukprot:TRINITY_DN46662_c0_g1_i1.p1 TRINITY_DN46662_c0_g1~~TRINITY_DN46662_c0_g1_i1.p1  ORF type:complete len:218 (-),score=28.93 TRINITY_DN46662_c0_g1_i1:137-718(-)
MAAAGMEAVEAFAARYPMDDRAFAYLASSSFEVRERVLTTFRSPREEPLADYSAPVTAYVKQSRYAFGEGPGISGGLLACADDSWDRERKDGTIPRDEAADEARRHPSVPRDTGGRRSVEERLRDFFDRYPVDTRAADFLSSCTRAVIERVVREFVPKHEGEDDYSALVMSFTKRMRDSDTSWVQHPPKRPRY